MNSGFTQWVDIKLCISYKIIIYFVFTHKKNSLQIMEIPMVIIMMEDIWKWV